ncbi:unnamed protein product [Ilex paraguariensis]|uniref:Bifunctional inhibitor/plant lipid transfer protein/seed storage helical domain-containing protein n=1 Tax=Ilex paraguariensis TaxID=185542 RepID=A0ABC8T9R1_9AQUA
MVKTINIALVQCVLVMVLLVAPYTTSAPMCNVTVSELAECLPAATGVSPPPPTKQCCTIIRKADLQCLCKYKSQLRQFGADPATAMTLPKKCGLRAPKVC